MQRYANVQTNSHDREDQLISNSNTERLPLGRYLATVRKDRGLSLRDVEKATERNVSNAYLSQIENALIKQPSPNILRALAEVYDLSYDDLMERTGYTAPKRKLRTRRPRPNIATFADQNLTEQEEAELVEYLGFMRSRRRHIDKN